MRLTKQTTSALVVITVLLIDQLLKIWIKTHFAIGDEMRVFGNWFILHFTENPGMAFGMNFWGVWGKLILSISGWQLLFLLVGT